MISFAFGQTRPALQRLLCLGAHSDDIEIGAGGTVLTLLAANPSLEVTWVVFSGAGPRAGEAQRSAEAFLAGAKSPKIVLRNYRDGFFPHQGAEIKETFEELKSSPAPDLVLTHFRRDLHQDHRTLSELTRNTFRDHAILEYEIPKYDGDVGQPNVYVRLTPEVVQRKVDVLLECFETQRGKRWFTDDLFRGYMRIRGMECNSPSTYAEAFHGHKLVLG